MSTYIRAISSTLTGVLQNRRRSLHDFFISDFLKTSAMHVTRI